MVKYHWLTGAKQLPCVNFNERPDTPISLIVIHNISLPPKKFGGRYIEDFFANQLDASHHPYFASIENLKVSSHLLIKRTGEVLQFVPFNKRAWHAGESCFKQQQNCNDFSIGIELEGTDDINYTQEQYKALNHAIKALKSCYLITDIVGHSDISPGRKTDPGKAFDWNKI
jgi:AmpD protein